jgi:hypothetical protein
LIIVGPLAAGVAQAIDFSQAKQYTRAVLRACTIDGFGWFHDGDSRRAYLLFDDIDYVLPEGEVGRLVYPPSAFQRPECQTRRVSLGTEWNIIEQAAEPARIDTAMRALVARVPAADRAYAREVLRTDPELSRLAPKGSPDEEVVAIAALASKLLVHAARTNTIPIVGRAYAYPILTRMMELSSSVSGTALSPTDAGIIASPGRRVALAALGAGLSLQFLDAKTLTEVPFAKLEKFKERNRTLLDRHQLHLAEVAQGWAGLPDGPDFAERLAKLRLDAEKQRVSMDDEARAAWRSLGLDLAKQAIVAGAVAAVPAIAALRGSTIAQLLGLSAPAILAGVGVVAKSVLEASEKARRAVPSSMAYLFEAERLLSNKSEKEQVENDLAPISMVVPLKQLPE